MIEAAAQFHFLRPWWLVLILPAFGLWWLQRREADTTTRWRKVIDRELLRHLIIGGDARRRFSPENLLLAAWLLGTLAVAGPTWRQVPSPFAQAARPAMFVVKVTPSMLERDLAPTRLDRARQKMADLLRLREGAPTGLVAYAGSAHLVLPPTPDASVVSTMAGALAPDLMPKDGDALADAIRLAADALERGGQGGSILVFADAAPVLPGDTQKLPVTLFAMLPPERVDGALGTAVATLDADLVTLTLDDGDVENLAHRLATAGPPPPAPGEGERWEEAGYWLTPLLALLALGWFRRGWVLA